MKIEICFICIEKFFVNFINSIVFANFINSIIPSRTMRRTNKRAVIPPRAREIKTRTLQDVSATKRKKIRRENKRKIYLRRTIKVQQSEHHWTLVIIRQKNNYIR